MTAAHTSPRRPVRRACRLLLAMSLLAAVAVPCSVAAGQYDDGDSAFPGRGRRKTREPERATPPPPRQSTPVQGRNGQMPQPRRIQGSNAWSIVLATFSGDSHAQDATVARDRLAQQLPQFRQAFVWSTTRGSAIMWGRFSSSDDPNAKTELERIQQFVYAPPQGGPEARPFARAMLTRLQSSSPGRIGPHDLRNLRRKYPKQDPLYTLQVAVWADFDGTVELNTIRRSAEAYAAQLRTQGYQAYYHHDDDLAMSVVTIGAFDETAYDAQSTLYSPELEQYFKKFPAHLVNGEPLLLRADPRNPRSPEYPQPCSLMQVPN